MNGLRWFIDFLGPISVTIIIVALIALLGWVIWVRGQENE